MDYKKPVMLAKSEPKRTFVAGCPTKDRGGSGSYCGTSAKKCEIAK